jgi:CDGSH-type Zn-finger protein
MRGAGPVEHEASMMEAVVAQGAPFKVEVQAGKAYWWCACGRSAKQPFCDGSHKSGPFSPVKWVPEASGPVWFCGCKRTATPPACDGSHKGLATP